MSKTILTLVEGWTPTIDAIVDDLGLLDAVVFGRVWRYCQMEDGICRARIDTIAAGIGLSRKTVQRRVKRLCEAGYLKDRTPGQRNKPHIYVDTGKAGLEAVIRAGRSESPSANGPGRSESPSRSVRESYEESKEERIVEERNTSPVGEFTLPFSDDPPPQPYVPGPGQLISCEDPDTGEEVGEPGWRFPQTQIQHQAFSATGRIRFGSKAEWNKMQRIERMLDSGEMPQKWWENRVYNAGQHGWSFPKLLKYTLNVDKRREWEARQ